MSFRTLFLDLDDTLYPRDCGVWAAVSARILGFMTGRMSFNEERATAVRKRYVERYGTTLKGLMLHHAIDPREYMAFVHDVPVRRMLQPDPELRGMLQKFPQSKWILTNADHAHADRVLEALDISAVLDGVIDFFDLSPYTKPQPEAYQLAMQIAGAPSVADCVLVDDQPRNVVSARQLGMTAVLVGDPEQSTTNGYVIRRIHDLAACLPELTANHRGG